MLAPALRLARLAIAIFASYAELIAIAIANARLNGNKKLIEVSLDQL